jgi:3-oxoacyl-[acyl-carrier-protein] synthase-1
MTGPVHIVATGARTPLGLTAASSAAAVRAGISRTRMHPFMVDGCGEPLIGAHDGRLEPGLFGAERLCALAESSLAQVHCALAASDLAAQPIAVLLALPETRPGFSERDADRVARALAERFAQRGADLRVELAGRGHAGALLGIEQAARWIEQGMAPLCIVGGADSYFDADTLDWLEADRRLARDDARSGFTPGEAASFLLLASERTRRAANLPSLAVLRGAATGTESRVLGGDDDVLGDGLARAVTAAAAGLNLPGEAVDAIYCDINGERYRSDEWALCAMRLQHALRDAAYEAPADCWGDVGAASPALACALATEAWARHYAQGPRALVWASSDGGLRGAAVLQQSEA